MTKVQLEYDLPAPLNDTLLERVAKAPALFGLLRVQVADTLDHLKVDYDASRLTRDQVEAALLGAGFAVTRRH
jgi:hypothetical protein